mmetsp:Transcript_22910/g.72550  ORF Transcript_22910/g.72550 Transcript_22910/m.72550 type:complete len:321 (-) Transcript_22910:812-1774(-)
MDPQGLTFSTSIHAGVPERGDHLRPLGLVPQPRPRPGEARLLPVGGLHVGLGVPALLPQPEGLLEVVGGRHPPSAGARRVVQRVQQPDRLLLAGGRQAGRRRRVPALARAPDELALLLRSPAGVAAAAGQELRDHRGRGHRPEEPALPLQHARRGGGHHPVDPEVHRPEHERRGAHGAASRALPGLPGTLPRHRQPSERQEDRGLPLPVPLRADERRHAPHPLDRVPSHHQSHAGEVRRGADLLHTHLLLLVRELYLPVAGDAVRRPGERPAARPDAVGLEQEPLHASLQDRAVPAPLHVRSGLPPPAEALHLGRGQQGH